MTTATLLHDAPNVAETTTTTFNQVSPDTTTIVAIVDATTIVNTQPLAPPLSIPTTTAGCLAPPNFLNLVPCDQICIQPGSNPPFHVLCNNPLATVPYVPPSYSTITTKPPSCPDGMTYSHVPPVGCYPQTTTIPVQTTLSGADGIITDTGTDMKMPSSTYKVASQNLTNMHRLPDTGFGTGEALIVCGAVFFLCGIALLVASKLWPKDVQRYMDKKLARKMRQWRREWERNKDEL